MTRLLAVACCCASIWLPTAAGAQPATSSVAATRAAIDVAAERWFDAQDAQARVDEEIAQLEARIRAMVRRVAAAREEATARALVLYKGSALLYTDVLGGTVIDAARRAELADSANARNEAAIDELTAAVDGLRAQRRALLARRDEQAKATRAVATERARLENRLTELRALTGAPDAAPRPAGRQDAPAAAPTAVPAALTAALPIASRGVSAHHDHPFLVCTRARESGGRYDIVSPSGLYYGAYQFLPTTWDATAVHAARPDLVGVLPSRASPYDQDEQAWRLYQWQGNRPWGGRC